jgi:hypothetical protein
MNIDAAKLVLARVKYKDGFTLKVIPETQSEMASIIIGRDIIDSDTQTPRHLSRAISVCIGKLTDSDLVHKVFAEILAWEQHEACEFFRFDDVQIFSPHANIHVLREALAHAFLAG